MSAADGPEPAPLPGEPPARLQAVYEALAPSAMESLRVHLMGGTSADTLADVLTRHGYPIGATTIKTYRRKMRQAGGAA